MKRALILILSFCMGAFTLNAQSFEGRYPQTEVSFTYSFYPRLAAEEFLDAHYGAITGNSSSRYGYQGNQVHTLGLWTGEIAFKLRKWFTVGVQLAGTTFWADTVNGAGQVNATAVYLLPNVRFTYVRSDVFKMYSGVGLGLGVMSGFNAEQSYFAGIGGADIEPAFQAVPVGIQFGRDIYGIAEVNLGTMNVGLRAGIGYRF